MDSTIAIDVEYISLLIGTVIPLLVALLTKANASSGTKAVVNALLSAITGFGTEVIANGGEFVLASAIVTVLLTWATSVATYYGLFKPTSTAEVVSLKTAKFGLGSEDRQVAA